MNGFNIGKAHDK